MSILNKQIVLVLNKAYQAINVRSPIEIFPMMATDCCVGLDIGIDGQSLAPTKWEDWLKLPVRENDDAILTVRGPIRIPRVVVLAKFAKVPTRRPKLSLKTIRERDDDTCQYSGRKLKPDEMSLDHIQARSRGGKNTPENVVLADKKINHKKSNRSLEEAGLKLLKKPRGFLPIPVTATIKNPGIPEWDMFLFKKNS